MLPMGDDDDNNGKGKKKPHKTFVAKNTVHSNMADPEQLVRNPRLLLFFVCFWPLAILALFASSAPGKDHFAPPPGVGQLSPAEAAAVVNANEHNNKKHFDKFELRKVLDRVDVMGYGPTHPRVAFVVVGSTKDALIESVESIFSTTDLNRIFVVCAVLDNGRGEDPDLVKTLRKIEEGSVPHWHGLKRDVHSDEKPKGDDEGETHSPKIHVMFHSQQKGLAASRSDAANFVKILVRTHEDAGFKSPDEDIILLLVQGGSQFKDSHWLSEVTPALIVAPPLLGLRNHEVAMKLANAISFHTEGRGKRTSFDAKLEPIIGDAPASDINMSSGKNFRTPALNGAAIAMRLGTFLNLPETDHAAAMDPWTANLDLALNLWLCADGIDILETVEVIEPEGGVYAKVHMDLSKVARVASTWMDDLFRERFFQAYAAEVAGSEADPENDDDEAITRVDWETAVTKSQRSNQSQQLSKRCRTFEWYIQEANTDLSGILEMKLKEDHRFDPVLGEDEESESSDSDESKDEKEEPIVGEDEGSEGSSDSDESKDEKEDESESDESQDEDEEEKEIEAHIAPPVIYENNAKEHSDGAAGEKAEKAGEDVAGKKKPSTPLRPENLEIVQMPEMVDVAFVDVSGGHEEHPHKLALDANGQPGYIHDETALRKNPPPLNLPDGFLKDTCRHNPRDFNYKMMHERIVVETEYEKTKNEEGEPRPKIFCLVYTIDKFHDRIPFIRETWGPKCDGFMVGSNATDPSIGAVNIPHEGPEIYHNIWQKVRSMWSYIYDNYYEKYDWFHIG